MSEIPKVHTLESSTTLLREGYDYIGRRCEELGTEVFQTRLLMQNTICLRGVEAARLFYDESLFQREHAAPRMLQKTLFGQGGVQTLDDARHRQRKGLFLAMLDAAGVEEMLRITEGLWHALLPGWAQQERFVVQDEMQLLLTRAVCQWAGVPLTESEVPTRRQQLVALYDGAGGIGPRHLQARHARKEAEKWAAEMLRQVRDGRMPVDAALPLARVAQHRELNGQPLDTHVAAVELLNLLRPTVAVERFIVFAVMELHRHPEWVDRLRREDHWLEPFAQEVRRVHAFFPFTAARVRRDFEWKGYRFEKGTRTLLDLYGTNRDTRHWQAPERFDPVRFEGWDGNAYSLVSQGGGDVATQHRCPGERLAIELIKLALRMFTRDMRYRVPEQDLEIDPSRIPARPASGMALVEVRPVAAEKG